MKYRLLAILLTCSLALSANDMEDQFAQVKQAFEQREKTAAQDLRQYLQDYPYTTYRSETQMMIGVLQVEKEKYKNALKTFQKVEWKQLRRDQQPMFFFYRGYCYLQQDQIKEASSCFKALRDSKSPYTTQGKYYYAYCFYRKGEYDKALPEFLAIEHTSQYRNIVPYYIVQIYYAMGEYEEVYDRCRYLLENNPDNENNSEIHRILGELYYSEGKYQVAANNLKEYDDRATAQGKTIVREDLYLLGMAEYRMKDYEAAIKYLKRVKQEKDTLSESTCLHLGHCYVQTNDIEKAKLSYAAAMRFDLTSAVREEAMYNYALSTYQTGTALGESITAFNDFLAAYPNTQHATQVYELLADMYMSSKNYKAALASIESIKQTSPELQKTKQYLRYQLGADAFLQGKMAEAKQIMTSVIEAEKGTSLYKTDAYYYRAEAEYNLQEYDLCYQDVNAFMRQSNYAQSGNKQMANYLKGYALFSNKKYTEAETAFRAFTSGCDKSQSAYTDALNRIGDCCFNARSFQAAIDNYNKVIQKKAAGADYALFQCGYAQGLMRNYSDKSQAMNRLINEYPKSDYVDDALYELARTELELSHSAEAINAYSKLINKFPNSTFARKASLEISMTYRNSHQYTEAKEAFKQTIEKYAGSQEAYSALEALEQIYVETNDISSYLAYTKQLGKMNMSISSQEDSLMYAAAELQYMLGNYKQAAAGLSTYISQYCQGGRYCTMAIYYAADSYYRLNAKTEAEALYGQLTTLPSNPYQEDAYTRIAEMSYDRKDYAKAREAFQKMQQLSTKKQSREAALIGQLRCNYFLNDKEKLIEVATVLLSDEQISQDVRDEALYNRAKAYMAQESYGLAVVDLMPLSQDVRIETGAEAKYLLAECYYRLGALDNAESEIMSFAGLKTQHQYWLAKSFILLSDINVKRGDTFQAKQYLLSLQQNYKTQDDIQSIISERLTAIDNMETPKKESEENDEE